MKRMRTLTTWVTCLTCFLAGLGGATGAVLCVGADGHVDLKIAEGGACSGFTPADGDHCVDCVDVFISVEPRKQATRSGRTGGDLAESLDPPSHIAADLADETVTGLVLRALPEGASTLASLRTVILLN